MPLRVKVYGKAAGGANIIYGLISFMFAFAAYESFENILCAAPIVLFGLWLVVRGIKIIISSPN